MADKNNTNDTEFNFEMFLDGDNGAKMLSDESLKEINKKLPKWSIKPPKHASSKGKDE